MHDLTKLESKAEKPSRAMFDRGLPKSGTFVGQPPWQLIAASAHRFERDGPEVRA
jgi:hypothetical protein